MAQRVSRAFSLRPRIRGRSLRGVTARSQLLYVDDDPAGAQSVQFIFGDALGVHVADTREAALRALSEHPIDVAIVEPTMCGRAGIDVIRAIRVSYPNVVCCLASAQLDVDLLALSDDEPMMHHFVTKPWDHRALELMVHNALRHGRLLRENKHLQTEVEALRARLARREEELAHSRRVRAADFALWRVAMEAAPDGIIIADDNGVIFESNPESERLFGFTRAELFGGRIGQLIPSWAPARDPVPDPAGPPAGGPRPELVVGRHRDGSDVPIEIAWRPIDAGPMRLRVAVFRDARARVAAEARIRSLNAELEARVVARTSELEAANEALFHSEETFRSVTSAALSAIMVLGPDGHTVLWNRAAERMFGWSEEEVIGRRMHEYLVPGEHRARHCEGFREFRRTGRGRLVDTTAELVALTKDGRQIPVEMSLSAVRRGHEWHAVAILNDITERQRVKRELVRAREAAEQANRAKSIFLANMSHEIRTPLNAILGFSQLLRRDPSLGPAHGAKVDSIIRGGEHLLELISDILEVSKLESGCIDVTPGTFDLRELLGDVEDMFRPRLEASHVSLNTTVSKLLPKHVRTDDRKIRQILVNLIANAAKFTERGVISVRAHVRGIGSELRLVLEVEDSGAGIADDDLKRIFEKFVQTKAGAGKGGTGLGLAICREYARRMGGDLTVASTLGVGSRFCLDIPVAIGCAADVTPMASTRGVLGLAPTQERLRILVVDDATDNREVLRELLGTIGFHVRTADSGAKAVSTAAGWEPHVVLMDIRMPGMDGYEATRSIKRALPATHVIAMSASAFREDADRAAAAGADGFIPKPFPEAVLLSTIRDVAGVSYEFVDPLAPSLAASSPEFATRESLLSALSSLSESTRQSLRVALATGDMDRFLDELSRSSITSGACSVLQRLARDFAYDNLLGLLDGQ